MQFSSELQGKDKERKYLTMHLFFILPKDIKRKERKQTNAYFIPIKKGIVLKTAFVNLLTYQPNENYANELNLNQQLPMFSVLQMSIQSQVLSSLVFNSRGGS